jgi:hypothetical protein
MLIGFLRPVCQHEEKQKAGKSRKQREPTRKRIYDMYPRVPLEGHSRKRRKARKGEAKLRKSKKQRTQKEGTIIYVYIYIYTLEAPTKVIAESTGSKHTGEL